MLGRNLLDAEVAVGRAEDREERDLRRELRGEGVVHPLRVRTWTSSGS